MQQEFEVLENDNLCKIINKNSNYNLLFDKNMRREISYQVSFGTLYPGQLKILNSKFIDPMEEMFVTARDLSDYPEEIQKMKINPKHQFVEIGAGLGGFMSYATEHMEEKSPTPIVIDLADYSSMKVLIEYALNEKEKLPQIVRDYEKRLEILNDRCSLIMNPNKIRLINMSLGESLETIKDLKKIADVAIDSYGAINYPLNEAKKYETLPSSYSSYDTLQNRVLNLEKELVKPKGKLISPVYIRALHNLK